MVGGGGGGGRKLKLESPKKWFEGVSGFYEVWELIYRLHTSPCIKESTHLWLDLRQC
jgi:hypothetical protein